MAGRASVESCHWSCRIVAPADNFDRTGRIHAVAPFSPEEALLGPREDVGGHKAVDKLIGCALRDGTVPLDDSLILVSGRVGCELIQKSVMAAYCRQDRDQIALHT